MSTVFGKIAELNSVIGSVFSTVGNRRRLDDDVLFELHQLKRIMVKSIEDILSAITPTLVSIDAITSVFSSVVLDWKLFPGKSSVESVASLLETLINETALLLDEEYVSKFSSLTVMKHVDSANSMLRASSEYDH